MDLQDYSEIDGLRTRGHGVESYDVAELEKYQIKYVMTVRTQDPYVVLDLDLSPKKRTLY